MPPHRQQAFLPDRIEKTFRSPVVQDVRWCGWREVQIHPHAVPLIGADVLAIAVDRKTLLVVGRHYDLKFFPRDGFSVLSEGSEQGIDRYPAAGTQFNADLLWRVPQESGESFRGTHQV